MKLGQFYSDYSFTMRVNVCMLYFYPFRNDLLGLEGMVKIKNPDENLTNGTLTVLSELNARNNNDIDAKRFVI